MRLPIKATYMKLIPTIFLPGACKDAIAFYRDALGA
jgi:uncharacterized glyoxalase superfamily protein PhnB